MRETELPLETESVLDQAKTESQSPAKEGMSSLADVSPAELIENPENDRDADKLILGSDSSSSEDSAQEFSSRPFSLSGLASKAPATQQVDSIPGGEP